MSVYDFQRATADRIAEIFRKATIDANGNEIKAGGQRRILLADEVGLGKTHVASAVIDRVREMRKAVNDDMFRVVYVCSNMSIANQNIEKLGVNNPVDVTESRLSMQHLTIREREAKIVDSKNDTMGEIIIPLTPSTSFSLRGSSKGNANERALIATILRQFDEFSEFQPKLSKLFQGRIGDNGWEYLLKRYTKKVNDLDSFYIDDVKRYLYGNQAFQEIKEELIDSFNHGDISNSDSTRIINLLRRIFADMSLSMIEPDLIIMDEFQRFSSLLDYNDESEQSAIVKKFFEQEDGQQPLILLLSATPYKPFSTLEELTEHNSDEHYEDFNRLMDFLFTGENEFRELWADYSHKLSHIHTEKFDVLLASKQSAENKMYQGMCRTERLNEGLISAKAVAEMPISTDDILSYCEMQKIVSACKEASELSAKHRFPWSNVPMEYVKSAPYLLSFMETYELKQKIDAIYRGGFEGLPEPSGQVLLRENDIAQFHKIPMRNARMQYLRDMMLPKGHGAELLLWVPASRPYYTTNAENPFVKNRDFSKTLVFSAWEMVPRMIATLMTYEAEREVIFAKYKKAGYDKKSGADRLKSIAQQIISFPSEYLASLYDPQSSAGEKIHIIRANIRRRIKDRLYGIPTSERRNYGKILRIIKWLDDPESEFPDEMPGNTVDMLTDMAIASPGVCLYRILKNKVPDDNELDDKQLAGELAGEFVKLFNRKISGYIIDILQNKFHNDEFYLDGVMDYCVMGNLQAVLDEYHHLCSGIEDFVARMKESIIREVPLQVDTYESFYEKSSNKKGIRTFYAVPFGKSKNSVDEKSESRSNNIRTAFQSPFYPFVLASTSVGQEGLDFHWYCRKILHWNLPSNPQNLEQREGRINRYKCLAIRRNLAKLYPDIYNWDELFKVANTDVRNGFGNRYSEMVPYWCLPVEWIRSDKDKIEWIERIIPQYPMSHDVDSYRRLIKVLALYRLTMGQPRQEELLEMLESQHLDESQIKQLLFDLSPISRHNG